MRISDWSSDVCSSDLFRARASRSRAALLRIRGIMLPIFLAAPAGRGALCAAVRAAARQSGCLSRISQKKPRSEEHTSELQSLMRISYAVFCLKKKTKRNNSQHNTVTQNNSLDRRHHQQKQK